MKSNLNRLAKRVYEHIPLKQPLFEVLRRTVPVPEPVYRHLLFRGIFRTAVNGRSFQMHHHGYLVENEVFWSGLTGNFEGVSLGLWIKLSERANTILDIGANTGLFSLVAKTVNPSAAVHAFEPLDRVSQRLRQNCALNGYDVTCVPMAASNRNGDAIVYDLPSDHIYAVTVGKNMNAPGIAVIERPIKTVTLDSYIDAHGLPPIDLIKMDVESHEPEVLEGFRQHLEQRPTMLVEVIVEEAGRRVEEIVAPYGYLYFDIDEKKGLRRMRHIERSSSSNYLLCSEQMSRELALDG
jgi:FkbM family methyltransferase